MCQNHTWWNGAIAAETENNSIDLQCGTLAAELSISVDFFLWHNCRRVKQLGRYLLWHTCRRYKQSGRFVLRQTFRKLDRFILWPQAVTRCEQALYSVNVFLRERRRREFRAFGALEERDLRCPPNRESARRLDQNALSLTWFTVKKAIISRLMYSLDVAHTSLMVDFHWRVNFYVREKN